jgi:hypothetical protein
MSYGQWTFRFTPPPDVQALLNSANNALTYTSSSSRTDLISEHMNNPRKYLSPSHLSHLVISSESHTEDQNAGRTLHHIFMTAPHFIGDGTSLHLSAHELLVLLTSRMGDEELRDELVNKWKAIRECWVSVCVLALELLLLL